MPKQFSILSVFLFALFVSPTYADWCRKPGGAMEPCGTIPSFWTDCGTFQEEAVGTILSEVLDRTIKVTVIQKIL